MKRIVVLALVTICCAAPAVMAQVNEQPNHVEVGVFADYLRFYPPPNPINFVGVGGRVSFNIRPSVQLEAEMAYDFERNFTTTFTNGVTTQFVRSSTRPLTGLFGPKFSTGGGPFRAFATVKLGFENLNTTTGSVGGGFTGGLNAVGNGTNTYFALYPGVGVEGFWGPFGLRADVGDQLYFNNGAQNNLRITFGPTFRF